MIEFGRKVKQQVGEGRRRGFAASDGEPGMASLKNFCLRRNLNEMRKQVMETSRGRAVWAEGTAGANALGGNVFC